MKKPISAKLLLRFIAIITVFLFVFSKSDPLNQLFNSPLLFVSQLLALVGAVLFGVSFFLATRTKLVENLSNGLDKAYETHHWLGVISFTLILNHQLLLITKALLFRLNPNIYFNGIGSPYWQGIVGLYILLTLIFITLFIKLPYHIWKITHKFMGIALFFGILHVLSVNSDVSRSLPLRIWVVSFMLWGFVSYLYKEFVYAYFIKKYLYKVINIENRGDILDIALKPVNKKMEHNPGQFVYISVQGNELVSPEEHPFSIASPCFSDLIRIGVNKSGDFTNNLDKLALGNRVKIQGPYGRFFDAMKNHSEVALIGGGIGITPFLGIACSDLKNTKIDVFYVFRSTKYAAYNKDLTEIERINPNIKYYPWDTKVNGHLTVDIIKNRLGDLRNKVFLLCGPSSMMSGLTNQLIKIGVDKELIYEENFYF